MKQLLSSPPLQAIEQGADVEKYLSDLREMTLAECDLVGGGWETPLT